MRTWSARLGILAACLVTLLATSKLPAAGQDSRNREDVQQALLAEVRGLRLAMEQMAASGPRVQLVMGRLQIQEQRLNAARRRLDEVRDSIANAERETAEGRDRLALMEDAAPRANEPAERESLAAQVKMIKGMLAQKATEIERLRQQEADLVGQAATEESRWTEISQRLDELERALAPRR